MFLNCNEVSSRCLKSGQSYSQLVQDYILPFLQIYLLWNTYQSISRSVRWLSLSYMYVYKVITRMAVKYVITVYNFVMIDNG